MNKAISLWRGLAPRERLLIASGALLLVLALIVVFAVQPLLEQRAVARERLARALGDSAWLQARIGQQGVSALRCPPLAADESMDALAARHGVAIETGSDPDGIRIDFSASGGNPLLAFLLALECQGQGLRSFVLESSDPQGRISGQALLATSVTKSS